nr:MAG TPA: hypothetical protein [Caudoviricetes sp.]
MFIYFVYCKGKQKCEHSKFVLNNNVYISIV